MEEMLLRPTIITCPEVKDFSSPASAKAKSTIELGAINLGARPTQKDRLELGSSESCTEILLDYVDDQSNQLRSDLKSEGSNTLKCMKLRNLLDRIEQIRIQLLEELKAGEAKGSKSDQTQDMINSIRQERADILSERTRTLNERESDLHKKEELLEKRLRKFYKETKGRKTTGGEEMAPKEDKPVEIIIKVRSDGSVKQYLPKGKSKFKENVISSEKKIPSDTPREEKKQTGEENENRPPPLDQRQVSIDSNSTAYRSLPPISYKSFNPGLNSAASSRSGCDSQPLHPRIVHYIQRLLGMSRQSIDNLGVSSSEVPTPPESIIETSRNKSQAVESNEGLPIVDEERLEQVQTFISENRSFINDLEDSLRMRQQAEKKQRVYDKETSSKAFDHIWNERLAQNQDDSQTKSKETEPTDKVPQKEAKGASLPRSTSSKNARHLQGGHLPYASIHFQGEQDKMIETVKKQKQPTKDPIGNKSESEKSNKLQSGSTKFIGKFSTKSAPGVVAEKPKSQGKEESSKQVERYERLAENCTQRIAELTDLITKVREEKQRLVEVTLTSNSDGERQSTEYYDLPNGQMQRQTTQSRSRTVSDRSDSQTPSTSEALPLQKNKPTAASRDSGIADSRPLTAMGQVTGVDLEPISLTTSSTSNAQRQRTKAPPATIRRYSPQLDAEDLAHELSTIAEVETPGQSHIVPATPVPQPFPTFEQYAKEMNLDLTQFDANQSRKMELEFNDLVRAINERTGGTDYREFPSINAYLHNVTDAQDHRKFNEHPHHDQTTLAPHVLMRQLRLLDVHLKEFPNRREYLQKILANEPSDQRQLIDSASLESSDSLNVEEELRQRNILKNSFRRASNSNMAHDVASSTRRESVAPNTNDLPNESGIDPLSGSTGSSDAEYSEQRIHPKPKDRQKRPEAEVICSSTDVSLERPQRKFRTSGGARSHNDSKVQDASQIGRSLNLREFLTRELLKHRAYTGETSLESSDDSLKGHFLKSVLSSLSPTSSPYTPGIGVSYATGITNDRQKTSTPVGSFSMADKSKSMQSAGTQLFSGESRISLVHYPDGTPPVPYEQQPSTNESRQKLSGLNRGSPRK